LLAGKLIFSFTGSSAGHRNIVEILLSKGADVNFKNKNGLTALIMGE
jgi:ankyrin repeat protein